MCEKKIFICEHCGNMVEMIKDSGVPIVCCGQKMTRFVPEEAEAAPVCDLKPVDTETNENYVVCKCNKVSYFDILDEIQKQKNLDDLLAIYEDVKNVTKCTTGCGGCYEKVLAIISDAISNK